MTDRLKIGQEVLIHGYVDEIRKDTIIIQNDGGYFGTVEHEITDIEASDTIEVLEKIRAEIESYEADCILADDSKECKECDKVFFGSIYRIIDKHRKEQE